MRPPPLPPPLSWRLLRRQSARPLHRPWLPPALPPLPPSAPKTATFEVVEFIVERGSWLFIFIVWVLVLLLRQCLSHSERHAQLGSEHHEAYQRERSPYQQSSGRLL